MTQSLLISRSHEYELRLQELFGDDLTSVMGAFLEYGSEVVFRHIAEQEPDVAFVGPYLNFETAKELCTGLRTRYPHIAVVLVHENRAAIEDWLGDLGADAVINPAATDDEVRNLVLRLRDPRAVPATKRAPKARAVVPPVPVEEAPTEEVVDAPEPDAMQEPAPEAESADDPPEDIPAPEDGPGRIIAVIAPKGGLGKTTIASNLAVGLSRGSGQSVVLVDADVQFGDVANVLALSPVHTLPDMVNGLAPRDTMVLKTFLTPHPAGFYIVGGADSPADGDRVTGDQLTHLIRQLADIFHYVIVDTTPGLGEHALAAIEQATDAVLLCSLGVPNLRALRKELAMLDAIGLLPPTRHIVLNFEDRTSGLNRKDAEATIGQPVDIVVPRSKAVPLSTNRGVPILQDSPRDPAAKAITQLVARIGSLRGARSGPARTKGVA